MEIDQQEVEKIDIIKIMNVHGGRSVKIKMTHRERVLAALSHQQPDMVPIDMGGSVDSSIVGLS